MTRGGTPSLARQISIAAAAPGVFSANYGKGQAIAVVLSDGAIAAPGGAKPGLASHPAKTGDFLLIYANGLGAVDHPIKDGADAQDQLRNRCSRFLAPCLTAALYCQPSDE